MCKWDTTVPVEVTVPAHLSYTGKERRAVKAIDSCIAPLVVALNEAGLNTIASCCGHGKQPASIALADGREVRIMTYEQARKVDELFEPINDPPV